MIASFPDVPNARRENLSEIADFAEITCLRQPDRNVSIEDIVSAMGRSSDVDDDTTAVYVEDAFKELEQRSKDCGKNDGRYPFELNRRGNLLTYKGLGTRKVGLGYLYLLFATRLNMQSERSHAGINGTETFERLCREVAERYVGGPAPSVGAIVFGTARLIGEGAGVPIGNAFQNAVNSLCKELGEGVGYMPYPDTRLSAKDDKLDVVAWRGFSDRRSGKLIAFGQCKTGTNWESALTQTDAESFCQRWMIKAPPVPPIRLFFVAERVGPENWSNQCSKGGVLFDRCRVVEYASDRGSLPSEISDEIHLWTVAAAGSKGIRL